MFKQKIKILRNIFDILKHIFYESIYNIDVKVINKTKNF